MISRSNRRRGFLGFAGTCGILGSTVPLIMILYSTFLAIWFRWDSNALSDLGVGEQALLFNSAVLLGGLLNFLFATGLLRYLAKERILRIGVYSIMIGSISLALVGVFTINYLAVHAIVALGYFLLVPTGFLLIGSGATGNTIQKVSFACGATALLAILLLPVTFFALPFRVGFAVPELIESLTNSVWTIFMSTNLLEKTKYTQNVSSLI